MNKEEFIKLNPKQCYCNGCHKDLIYYSKYEIYDPLTEKKVKNGYQTGFACCEKCDLDGTLKFQRSIPHNQNGILDKMTIMEIQNKWKRK